MATRNSKLITKLQLALMHIEDFFDDKSVHDLSHRAFDHICYAEEIIDELIKDLENE